MDKFKIDYVALQSGLTKRTIRYYEQISILPSPQRSEGGIRYYNQEHIDLLKKIKNAKEALGFSLQELQQFISLNDMIENYKADYKNSTDQKIRREKLIEISNTIDEKLKLVEQKLQKIDNVKGHLLDLKERTQSVIQKIDLQCKQE